MLITQYNIMCCRFRANDYNAHTHTRIQIILRKIDKSSYIIRRTQHPYTEVPIDEFVVALRS